MAAMKVTTKGKRLIIELDLQDPTPSASGKTLVVASTRGNQTSELLIGGKPVTVGVSHRVMELADR